MNILIVEDDINVVQLLMITISSERYRAVWPNQTYPNLTAAHHGREAIELAEQQRFDLVVIDISLPDMSGMEVARRIRASSPVPIMFVTSRAEPMWRQQAADVGAIDYVVKPFELDDLFGRMARALAQGH